MPRPPQQQQQQQRQARAVVAQGGERRDDGPSQALVRVTQEIDNRLAIITASAAAGIDADRLKLVALTAFTRNPDLLACEPVSIARAIVEAGQLGLEPTGLLGGAYLVPRAGKATLLVGYKGLVMLAKRSGEVSRIEARVVRAKDVFVYAYGLVPRLDHVPSMEADPGAFTHAYAVIHYRDGTAQFDVMSWAEIQAIRRRSSSPNAGPWVTDEAEMAKKTVLRRALKLAPLSVQVAAKIDELDPEVDDQPANGREASRQAELRRQLQSALEREYGTAPAHPQLGAGPTTHAQQETAGQATTSAEGGAGPSSAPAVDRTVAAADLPAAAATTTPPAQPSEPTRVAAILSTPCGASWPPLEVGPCVLPKGHDAGAWRDTEGTEHPAQGEHQEAGGTRWTQPKEAPDGAR